MIGRRLLKNFGKAKEQTGKKKSDVVGSEFLLAVRPVETLAGISARQGRNCCSK